MSILQPFYNAIAWLVVHIHDLLGGGNGASWVLAIILLTVFMRILLIPLFVRQIKSQRAMTAMQPQIKALQKKYAGDKTKLNEELMKLYKETGFNPLMGCLPLLPQIPIFFALFHTLDKLRPTECVKGVVCTAAQHPFTVGGHRYIYQAFTEFPQHLVQSAAQAKIFGVPIAAAFNSDSQILNALHASTTSTRVLCAVLTLVMVATTFLTQRQMLARNAANNNTPVAGQQKAMLYILPLIFLFYGYRFPIGVLFYWLTTNVWTMGQQFFVLRRMDATVAGTATPPPAAAGPAPGAKPDRPKPSAGPTAAVLPAEGPKPTRPLPPQRGGGQRRSQRKKRRR